MSDQWTPLAELCALASSPINLAEEEDHLARFREAATPAVVLDLIQHARRAEHPGHGRLALAVDGRDRALVRAAEAERLLAQATAELAEMRERAEGCGA